MVSVLLVVYLLTRLLVVCVCCCVCVFVCMCVVYVFMCMIQVLGDIIQLKDKFTIHRMNKCMKKLVGVMIENIE